MEFQDKFYDIIDHHKCPSSEKSTEKCILRKSNFHQILPKYGYWFNSSMGHGEGCPKFHAIIPTYAVGGWVVVVGLDCALSAAESQMLM